MKKDKQNRLANEQKYITMGVFNGLTISQMADKLNCSQSTISNRLNVLFKKYNAKTRYDFILAVFGEITKKNNNLVDELSLENAKLEVRNEKLILVVKKIIENLTHKENLKYWINEAKTLIE